jgi:hypothetical protein
MVRGAGLRGASLLTVIAALLASGEEGPTLVVRGPTIVAFFGPVKDADLKSDPDTNEALADLQLYARRVSTTLRHSGTKFKEYFDLSFGVC